jgi:hypothetical protein
MIEIRCANCQGTFQANDEADGSVDRCPACGAINDVPSTEPDLVADGDVPFVPANPRSHARKQPGGIPSVFFWLVGLALIAGFVFALVVLFSSDWEAEHLPAIANLVTSADAAVSHRDYETAIRQYQDAINIAGTRTIQSLYLQKLLQHARQSQADAQMAARLESTSTRPGNP